jgi:hypothetical protein|tara:strand:- start:186 stop:419 length:234 start_codon:yes stop_codon:yes gene_type:complete
MKLYSCNAVEQLIENYINEGGEVTEIQEGCLGYGQIVLHGDGLKTAVVTERPLNEWSSGHSVRFYAEMPKKYLELAI